MTDAVTEFNHSGDQPAEVGTEVVKLEELPTVSKEMVANEGDEPQEPNSEALLKETSDEEATGNDKKPQSGKPQRIGADGLEAERQKVYSRLDRDPDEQVLAIAIDLDIPEERVLKYVMEWKAKDAKILVLHPKDVLRALRQRLRFANGKSPEDGTPWRLEFDENDTSVTITLYEKKG